MNTNSENDNSYKVTSQEEHISALIDSEVNDDTDRDKLIKEIESNPELKNRFEMEKLVKLELKSRIKRIETPQYVYQNIYQKIDIHTKKISKLHNEKIGISSVEQKFPGNTYQSQQRKYFYLFASAFAVLALMFLSINYVVQGKSIPEDANFVLISKGIYDKVQAGEIKIQYATNDAKDLTKFFDEKLNYKVFIPDVKDAVLLGGVYNEMNGKKVAHFIHKKDDMIIYTFQANLNDIMDDDNEELMISGDIMDEIKSGENWVPCKKESRKNKNIIIWCKDDVISSSISEMGPNAIYSTLTNYK